MTSALQSTIDAAWEQRADFSPTNAPSELREAVNHVIEELNAGRLRVATREAVGQWTVHQWLKKAVLLSFRLQENQLIQAGDLGFYDKVPTRFGHLSAEEMAATGVRVVPPAVARRGSFIAPGAILMPSYVNIGAYVGEGTMVDTWATVGSCAQVGKHVHLSGGVGQSTPIYDRATGEVSYGRVPAGSVVISGSLPKEGGKYSMYAAIIVKRVDAKTRSTTSLNDLLRD